MQGDTPRFLAVNVGNTRTAFALFQGDSPDWSRSVPNKDREALGAALRDAWRSMEPTPGSGLPAVVMASVNDPLADALAAELAGDGAMVYRMNDDIPIPVVSSVEHPERTGQDRLLAALAAFDTLGQACVVVDAGTALTVDFVDGEGTFQGGAILPGARMGLAALHERTAALPEVALDQPAGDEPFGKNTRDAMLHGAIFGARGAVRLLTERYAERFGAYPLIIATGGDAEFLFSGDELIDRVVPDLVLRGIAIAVRASVQEGGSGLDGR